MKGLHNYICSDNPKDYEPTSDTCAETYVGAVNRLIKMAGQYEIDNMNFRMWDSMAEIMFNPVDNDRIANVLKCTVENFEKNLKQGKVSDVDKKFALKQIALLNKMTTECYERGIETKVYERFNKQKDEVSNKFYISTKNLDKLKQNDEGLVL